jgi:hypothetical protein
MRNLLQKNSLFTLKLYALNTKKMIIIINPTCKNISRRKDLGDKSVIHIG